jgi:hypothetical protein
MQPRLLYPHSRKVLSQLETRAAGDERDTVGQSEDALGMVREFWVLTGLVFNKVFIFCRGLDDGEGGIALESVHTRDVGAGLALLACSTGVGQRLVWGVGYNTIMGMGRGGRSTNLRSFPMRTTVCKAGSVEERSYW